MKQLTKQNIKTIVDKPGVYKIFVRCRDNKPIPISRFAKMDYKGLIYIGRTIKQTLKKRLENFLLTHNSNKTTNHSGALKLRTTKIIKLKFGKGYKLYFTCKVCKDPVDQEKQLLSKYRNIYGETPLLNG